MVHVRLESGRFAWELGEGGGMTRKSTLPMHLIFQVSCYELGLPVRIGSVPQEDTWLSRLCPLGRPYAEGRIVVAIELQEASSIFLVQELIMACVW